MLEITTERNNNDFKFNQVVFEWEDDLVKGLDGKLFYMGRYNQNKYFNLICEYLTKFKPFKWNDSKPRIGFVMFVRQSHRYKNVNSLPIYLDVHERWVDKIISDTKKLKKFFVTSYDVYKLITAKTKDDRCCYLPLSISDKYLVTNVCGGYTKSVDVVQLGRKNQFLHDYMMDYIKKYPSVEYVYLGEKGYISTTRGLIGDLNTREKYMQMLQSARISLVSTPGAGEGKSFGNIDFFTPRFYESMAAYCHIIGRYTENEEAELLNIKKFCPNIQDFDSFEMKINSMLADGNDALPTKYKDFLEANCTSARAKKIKQELESAGML